MFDRPTNPAPLTPDGDARPFSPCTGDCAYNPANGLCKTCLRTLDEVANWVTMSAAQRERVWQRIAARRADGE